MSKAISAYLNEISRYPLLTAEQEIDLARRIKAAQQIDPEAEHTATERKILKSGKRAWDQFLSCNLRLVVNIAKKYDHPCRRSMELLDLIQAGSLGLVRAVEMYDSSRGYKFSTYAYWWIRQSIQHAIAWEDTTIRIPTTVHDAMMKSSKAKDRLSHQLGRQPTLAELAKELGTQPDDLLSAIRCTRNVGSLDAPSMLVEDSSIMDLLSDNNALTPDEQLDRIDLDDRIDKLNQALEALDDATRHVLLARTVTTRAQLSRDTGMSHGQIQRREVKGKYRCRLLMNMQNKKKSANDPIDDIESFEHLAGTPLGELVAQAAL